MTSGSRRAFLVGTGAEIFRSAVGAAEASGIIDTHIHLYDPTRPQGIPWPPKGDALLYKPVLPPDFERLVRPIGVTGAVVIEASSWVEDNQWLLDLARDNPFILGVVGHLEPGTPEFRERLKRFSKNPLFRGIRLNGTAIQRGLERPEFLEHLRAVADGGLALDAIGSATMIASLLRLTSRIPNLRVVIDHLPVEPTGWAASSNTHAMDTRAALRDLAKRPQVYAKVSGVLRKIDGAVPTDLGVYKPALDEVWTLFGADRVMFGSNWPVSDRLGTYSRVLRIVRDYVKARTPGEAEKFLRLNSKAFYVI
ncbi:MAG: amidohydrolase family protein [Bryobacteraceae bacterium]|nr:amidohydrolase family protein [Bryobacteraceae bacterium]